MLAAALCAISACSGGEDEQPISESCREALEHSDLEWIQDNVFTPSCAAFSVCHQGAASSALGLNLETGMSEAALVGVPSATEPSLNLVEPGNPEDSYLMHTLGAFGMPRFTMPLNNPPLCPEKQAAVERWIESLATAAP